MSYREYYSYAYVLCGDLYRDIVHEAWLKYYEKTGLNLFDQNKYYVFRAIKYAHKSNWGEKYYYWRGETVQRQFTTEDIAVDGTEERYAAKDLADYYREIILKKDAEVVKRSKRKSANPDLMIKVLDRLPYYYNDSPESAGDKTDLKELSKDLGFSKQVIGYYIKKIRNYAREWGYH